jgi:hypothetical protein
MSNIKINMHYLLNDGLDPLPNFLGSRLLLWNQHHVMRKIDHQRTFLEQSKVVGSFDAPLHVDHEVLLAAHDKTRRQVLFGQPSLRVLRPF